MSGCLHREAIFERASAITKRANGFVIDRGLASDVHHNHRDIHSARPLIAGPSASQILHRVENDDEKDEQEDGDADVEEAGSFARCGRVSRLVHAMNVDNMGAQERIFREIAAFLQELVDAGDLEISVSPLSLAVELLKAMENGSGSVAEWLLEYPAVDEVFIGSAELDSRFRQRLLAPRKGSGVAPCPPDQLALGIISDPSDLGARAVYADWLMEHDDPRGELMTLQLELARTSVQRRATQIKRRIKELLAENARTFYGELAMDKQREAVERVDVTFEHGFFTRAAIPDEHNLRVLLTLESSRFLETLHVVTRSADVIAELLTTKPLPKSLRSFTLRAPTRYASTGRCIGRFDLKLLDALPHLEHLELGAQRLEGDVRSLLRLKRLTLNADALPAQLEVLLTTKERSSLERVRVEVVDRDFRNRLAARFPDPTD